MASVGTHSAQKKFFAKHLAKKRNKKKTAILSIYQYFLLLNPPKYEISMFLANLAFE